jgi:hypothetical protein
MMTHHTSNYCLASPESRISEQNTAPRSPNQRVLQRALWNIQKPNYGLDMPIHSHVLNYLHSNAYVQSHGTDRFSTALPSRRYCAVFSSQAPRAITRWAVLAWNLLLPVQWNTIDCWYHIFCGILTSDTIQYAHSYFRRQQSRPFDISAHIHFRLFSIVQVSQTPETCITKVYVSNFVRWPQGDWDFDMNRVSL